MDVLFDIFAPFNTALRPKVRTARADRQPQHKATTSQMANCQKQFAQNTLLACSRHGSGCRSCSHPHAQGMPCRFHMLTGDGFTARDARNLLSLITQSFGR